MCENAREGFWNGSHAPFGYKVEVKEKRGNSACLTSALLVSLS
jgi:hypothetical protein